LAVTALVNGTFRIQIDDPADPRHQVPEALDGEPIKASATTTVTTGSVTVQNGDSTAEITFSPFVITVTSGEVTVVLNQNQKMEIKSDADDKAISMDFTFPGAKVAYGIPEHAEPLALKTSKVGGRNPYRMFNVDNYGYPANSNDPLYGTLPVLYAHGTRHTSGIFWLTSAQTFVDVNTETKGQVDSLFISQSGAIDIFVFVGPTLPETVKQYTTITGRHPLPQLFALGYHQSRYSYLTQDDLLNVTGSLDLYDYPHDVLWLDLDYTDAKKYFTWNYTAFPDPLGMQTELQSNGRKLVVIIDPHIKVEPGYPVYDQMIANNYAVMNADGTPYEANCWPGLSVWADFTNPEVRDWYGSFYQFENFPDTTEIVYIWNDMNEPAVFDVDEKTMPDNARHFNNWEHKDVHNMYGLLHTMSTYQALLDRSGNTKRPFILTRSHFAGSQRYTALWTGDNVANWEHLRISIPLCLAENLAGMAFCGADVGGFTGDPDDELLQRWFQLGAWYPFFREHNAIDTERREPYLFPEDMQVQFRAAVKGRYYHLPYWYTKFYENERFGEIVMRPLSYNYVTDETSLTIDEEFMIGTDILVAPVLYPGVTNIDVYLPSGSVWYNIQDNLIYGSGWYVVPVTIKSVPVFYRGGSIIPRKDVDRKSSVYTHDDPYTLYIFLDENNVAEGTLYQDDFESFDYRSKVYNYMRYTHENNVLTSSRIDEDASYEKDVVIGDAYVYSVNGSKYTKAKITENGAEPIEINIKHENNYFKLSNLNIKNTFTIEFL